MTPPLLLHPKQLTDPLTETLLCNNLQNTEILVKHSLYARLPERRRKAKHSWRTHRIALHKWWEDGWCWIKLLFSSIFQYSCENLDNSWDYVLFGSHSSHEWQRNDGLSCKYSKIAGCHPVVPQIALKPSQCNIHLLSYLSFICLVSYFRLTLCTSFGSSIGRKTITNL